MGDHAAVHRNTRLAPFLRSVRAVAEASLVALAFGFTIVLIGIPLALSVRGVHESFSWVARLGGEIGPLGDALVSIAGVIGGIMVTAVSARALVGFFRWRGALRQRRRTSDPAAGPLVARLPRAAES